MWILMVSVKGGYKAHSIHQTIESAKAWQQCKEHDGEDCSVCEVKDDELYEYVDKFRPNNV